MRMQSATRSRSGAGVPMFPSATQSAVATATVINVPTASATAVERSRMYRRLSSMSYAVSRARIKPANHVTR